MADEWGVNYRPRPKYQFVWWSRLQFWFVRDRPPLAFIYAWRWHIGPLEVRRWNDDRFAHMREMRVKPHQIMEFEELWKA